MTDQCAVSLPQTPPTAADIDHQWRNWGVIEVMIRNPNVDSFVREKEIEVERLWKRIRDIASQSDPAWAVQMAKQLIAEREV